MQVDYNRGFWGPCWIDTPRSSSISRVIQPPMHLRLRRMVAFPGSSSCNSLREGPHLLRGKMGMLMEMSVIEVYLEDMTDKKGIQKRRSKRRSGICVSGIYPSLIPGRKSVLNSQRRPSFLLKQSLSINVSASYISARPSTPALQASLSPSNWPNGKFRKRQFLIRVFSFKAVKSALQGGKPEVFSQVQSRDTAGKGRFMVM